MSEAPVNNFVDFKPISAYARRLTARIPISVVRKRFAHVLFDVLQSDPRNARPILAAELADAPDWVLTAHLQGRALHVFEPDPEAIAPVRRVLRALNEACREVDYFESAAKCDLSMRERVVAQIAKEFLAKISRMSYRAIADKARYFKEERRERLRRQKLDQELFPREEVYAAPGRTWKRIVSVSELAALGAELGNCLSETARQHGGYARRLRADTARFWALRDHKDRALMAAMIDPSTGRILEVRGPRNAYVSLDDSDLAALVRARQLTPPPSSVEALLSVLEAR